jgi:hypothetical protein
VASKDMVLIISRQPVRSKDSPLLIDRGPLTIIRK